MKPSEQTEPEVHMGHEERCDMHFGGQRCFRQSGHEPPCCLVYDCAAHHCQPVPNPPQVVTVEMLCEALRMFKPEHTVVAPGTANALRWVADELERKASDGG